MCHNDCLPPLPYRDIKCGNVLLRRRQHAQHKPLEECSPSDVEVFLADFGLAFRERDHGRPPASCVGTRGFQASEVAEGPYTKQVDCYSMGQLYGMLR